MTVLLLVAACGERPAPPPAADTAPAPATAALVPPPPPFDTTLALQDVTFRVESPNAMTGNTVTITATGRELGGRPEVRGAAGRVVGAEVADLDANGSPEVYVYVREATPEGKGSLVALVVNRGRSLSDATLPAVGPASDTLAGYAGRDEFAVGEGALLRRWPREGAGAAGWRQLQYRLKPGEAGWQLRVERMTDF
jgi:hypothetical protein